MRLFPPRVTSKKETVVSNSKRKPGFLRNPVSLVASVILLSVLALAAGAAGQVASSVAQSGPVPAPPNIRPGARPVPVGTATLSGTVTAADTGRPIRGARVMLSMSPPTADPSAAARGLAMPVLARGTPAPAGATGITTVLAMSLNRTAVTDADGRFSVASLPAGPYRVTVTRQPYLTVNYGQRKFGRQGADIPLADGQRLDLKIALPRGGVITGTLFDENGDPASGAQVRLLRMVFQNGVKRPSSANFANADDRGMYRVANLQPGDYLIAATLTSSDLMMNERAQADEAAFADALAAAQRSSGGKPVTVVALPVPQGPQLIQAPSGYLPTYFPGTGALASAQHVTIDAGEERDGVDVRLLTVRASTITGTVTGAPNGGIGVQVTALIDDPSSDTTNNSTRAQPNGRFTLQNLAPGRYTVTAQTVPPPSPPPVVGPDGRVTSQPVQMDDSQRLWAVAAVDVTGQSTAEVALGLQPGRSISGRVIYNMERPPDLSRQHPTVTLSPAPAAQSIPQFGPMPQGQIAADGRFTITGVSPGRYLLRCGPGFERSVMSNGVDTLDSALVVTGEADVADVEITMTDRGPSLSGALMLASGAAANDYTIVLAPSDPRYWAPGSRRVLTTPTRSGGRYSFGNIPPGEYLLAAVTDLEQGGQYDPDFLRAITGASVHVTIGEGAQVTQDLRATQ